MQRVRARLKAPVDVLWPAVVLAAFGVLVSLMPLPPNDFWWHLRIGTLILDEGRIPSTNMFGWTIPAETPFTYGAWLGEVLLALLYRAGGLPLPTFARNLLALTAFALIGWEARRRSGSWRLAALALALAAGMSLNNLVLRPQIWSWLPFVVSYLLLARFQEGSLRPAALFLLPPLMVFWVNAHGAFILGPTLLFLFLAGGALEALLGRRPLSTLRPLAGIVVLTLLAILLNPQGIGILGYVHRLLTDRPSQTLVVEWASPTPHGFANVTFYGSLLILLLALAYSRHRLTPTEALLIVAFLWLAWNGQRYVIWFGMVAAPILARLLAGALPPWPWPSPPPRPLNTLLAALLFLPVLAVQPWWVERIPLPETYWRQVWRGSSIGPLVGIETPVDAVEYLRAHPGGRLFNEMGYGSYLIWALPGQNVFVDPRVELYPYELWLDYIRISRAARYNELLTRYGVDRLLIDRILQEELARALEADPRWEKEFEGVRAQVWRRKVE
ncbi:hypothetical protein HRbin22_00896 [Candidatus Thermoflexus japonica]|uniref:Glycosyltransferase RgtA/B/C/D-like domain-containing protein n=1 Tax=Candidatus Thermoflexus japonica TaxID=2035417 RepID=A0A2H5Y5E0_9CHLR|nr:hypothetical protein HRbin22_00896 [Candidatus Thermoflexus japonica]